LHPFPPPADESDFPFRLTAWLEREGREGGGLLEGARGSEAVRLASLRCLLSAAPRGHPKSVSYLMREGISGRAYWRETIEEVMSTLALRGDSTVVSLLCAGAAGGVGDVGKGGGEDVREACVQMLGRFASIGDASVVALLL
jgi:hypothetical protein